MSGCTACGASLGAEARFCPACGAPRQAAVEAQPRHATSLLVRTAEASPRESTPAPAPAPLSPVAGPAGLSHRRERPERRVQPPPDSIAANAEPFAWLRAAEPVAIRPAGRRIFGWMVAR